MAIPREIIDNADNNKLVTFLNTVLKDNKETNLDIATAFFNIQAYVMIKENLGDVKRFRLLLGTTPEIKNDCTLGKEILKTLKDEIEGFELSKETDDSTRQFIDFLNKPNVEVRLFEQFLHGKAYIFDNLIVVGSSNFTSAGLTRYGELNTWQHESLAVYTKREWFDKFWNESRDFKAELITLLENSRFGSVEYTPHDVYMKALFELQKEDFQEAKDEEMDEDRETMVNLTNFQADAVQRVYKRLAKYGAVFIADSVGLGKTYIALKVIEKYHLDRRQNRILVICPAQLRELVWSKELKNKILPTNILSQEDLATDDFLNKAKDTVGGKLDEIKLIIVDESHNLRNPLSNRWENFLTLVNNHIAQKGNRPFILFLTATPINNTIWDLYWQIGLMVGMNQRAFIKENIPNLFKFFKEVEDKDDPSLLNDILNEIAIRRTRDYIVKNYPDAYRLVDQPDGTKKKEKITFPKRRLKNIKYNLDATYKGMYKEISDTITEKLKMAYYRILEYKKEKKLTVEEVMALGRMVAISGIFKTILLKRLESSVYAFRLSLKKHISFLEMFKQHIAEGKLLTKETFNKYLMWINDELEEDEYREKLEDLKPSDFRINDLIDDVDTDIKLLSGILKRVNTIEPKEDAKLIEFKDKLLELSEKGQVVVFTYYADTLEYLFKELPKFEELKKAKIEAISSSGRTTGRSVPERARIIQDFFDKKIDILLCTDVLSEGQNLQTAQYLINYDLHWNPTRMVQRAGRIDRIGSKFKEIMVYNIFPEKELDTLLKLVEILQGKIINIDKSVGLDQSILGEVVHPKVFGTISRIHAQDEGIFDDLERNMFGGSERFFQPLKDYLKVKAVKNLEKIPYGIHSGLHKKDFKGIFFYYKYKEDFHYWFLYDMTTKKILERRSKILDFIDCPPNQGRVIPDFFDEVYKINKAILKHLEESYRELEQMQTASTASEMSTDRSQKFVKTLIHEMESRISEQLEDFPEDKKPLEIWEVVRKKLLSIPLTKKMLHELRRIWNRYKSDENWKRTITDLNDFLFDKVLPTKEKIDPFDRNYLKLVVVDFIS